MTTVVVVVGGMLVAEVVPDREYSQQNPFYGRAISSVRQRRCILRIFFIFYIFLFAQKIPIKVTVRNVQSHVGNILEASPQILCH